MGSSKELKTYDGGGGTVDLLCPRCGANNLHHEAVRIYDRREDAEKEVLTKVRGGVTRTELVNANPRGNPSMRRDGLVVEFSCEQCGGGIDFTIAQHKGSTEVGWRFTD